MQAIMDHAKRNKSLGAADANRPKPSHHTSDDNRHSSLAASRLRGKKDKLKLRESEPPPSRSSTPKHEKQEARRSSAPSTQTGARVLGAGNSPNIDNRRSPRAEQDGFDPKLGRKDKGFRRREGSLQGKHFDPVLSSGSRSPSAFAKDVDATSPFTYAQALGIQPRTAITTTPVWEVEQHSPRPVVPISSRQKSPILFKVESGDSISEAGERDIYSDNEDVDNYDSATDLSLSTYSDHDVPEDIDRDDRLINPEGYFRDLERLEANVTGNSGLFLMRRVNRQKYPSGAFDLQATFHTHSGEVLAAEYPNYDKEVLSFCKKHPGCSSTRYEEGNTISSVAYRAFHLLECRNLMLAVLSNVEEMRRAKYCDTSINFLSLDRKRSSVAKLNELRTDSIRNFHAALEAALQFVVEMIRSRTKIWTMEIRKSIENVTRTATELLTDSPVAIPAFAAGIWRTAAILSDLAVVSYSGAHTERFDLRFISEDLNCAKVTSAWTFCTDGSHGMMLRQRSLKCLDDFLGNTKVWVVQSQSAWADDQQLYLSTTINQFTDIWGPTWAVKSPKGELLRYNSGSGAIVAWSSVPGLPSQEDDEVVAHWVRFGDHYPAQPLRVKDGQRLLIGSPTIVEQKASKLKENEDCQNKTNKVIHQLKSQNLLEEIGTQAEYFELSEQTAQLGIGFNGVSLQGSKVYKRRAGVTLKEAICNAWVNRTGNRNPGILDQYLGVEVSFCSRNARRRRLRSILNTSTMRNWLDACKISAEPFPCEKAFFDALANEDNPDAFQVIWRKHPEWRRDLEQLVSWCLEGLRHSSIDQDYTLHALWMPRDVARYRVKIKYNPHSWTSFLADSQEKCTFAVVSGRCFNSDYKGGATCQKVLHPHSSHMGYSMLETSLSINQNAHLPPGLVLREKTTHRQPRWGISRLKKGDYFPLETGRLRVIETFANTRLLVDFEIGIFKLLQDAHRTVAKVIGDEVRHHWELQSLERAPTKPVPLFILSQYEHRRS